MEASRVGVSDVRNQEATSESVADGQVQSSVSLLPGPGARADKSDVPNRA